ncbi:MAG: translation elongation factor Ts [Bacteroidales bacterium]|jgi:elongation factor Ts|nr:translation elongation factor Ts [Bacteroidales bacterium]
MSNISAADVAKLRRMTGAGMMDCKKALEEATGDFEKAQELIRKRGQAIANKRADREASEGVVLAKTTADAGSGMMISLNCETDFVAKNADFIALGYKILDAALENAATDLDALKNIIVDGKKVSDLVIEKSGITGEKYELSYFGTINAPAVQAYIHPGNKLATLVGFSKAGIDIQVYKDVAMQVAAMNPVSLDKEDVPEKILAQELDIAREQARREGKPEEMLEKIAQGKLNKFFKESTLMNQEFIKDSKHTIRQYLESKDKTLKATGFIRYTLNI